MISRLGLEGEYRSRSHLQPWFCHEDWHGRSTSLRSVVRLLDVGGTTITSVPRVGAVIDEWTLATVESVQAAER